MISKLMKNAVFSINFRSESTSTNSSSDAMYTCIVAFTKRNSDPELLFFSPACHAENASE